MRQDLGWKCTPSSSVAGHSIKSGVSFYANPDICFLRALARTGKLVLPDDRLQSHLENTRLGPGQGQHQSPLALIVPSQIECHSIQILLGKAAPRLRGGIQAVYQHCGLLTTDYFYWCSWERIWNVEWQSDCWSRASWHK